MLTSSKDLGSGHSGRCQNQLQLAAMTLGQPRLIFPPKPRWYYPSPPNPSALRPSCHTNCVVAWLFPQSSRRHPLNQSRETPPRIDPPGIRPAKTPLKGPLNGRRASDSPPGGPPPHFQARDTATSKRSAYHRHLQPTTTAMH